MYAPLWVKSHFSFLEGASSPEALVEAAHALGLPALALTDRDGVHGIVRAHVRAKALGLPLVVGTQITVGRDHPTDASEDTHVVLLAKDREGYGGLCRLVSRGRARCAKGSARVTRDELTAITGGVVALATEPTLLPLLRERFEDDAFAIVARHLVIGEREREAELRDVAARHDVPLVAATRVLYHHRARKRLQDVLACLRHGRTLATAGTCIEANDEHDLLPPAAMRARYADIPDALDRTLEVVARCTFRMGELRYRYPSESLPEGRTAQEHLRVLTRDGLTRRCNGPPPHAYVRQLEHELEVIGALEYGGYFLTMHEIVRYCVEHGILCQGRGSAANSLVCYSLGVTAIDPVERKLLFERFLSKERAEPPDIDLDIEHERREEVIQHVYARFGRRHAAMVANVIRYRARSAVRDVGKVLGIPQTKLDGVAHLLGYFSEEIDDLTYARAGLDPKAPGTRLLAELCAELVGFPRHLSIHPGGFLLGHDPVDALVPIEPATMEGRTVVQWDKYDVEALGLFKVDLLGLGALTVVRKSLALIAEHTGKALTLATIPPEDPDTYAMIRRAETIGVFQIESRAQMSMLPRLEPREFYDLVIQVAIVRPGPIQGGMVHPYLKRRAGEEPIDFPHERAKEALAHTLGVPIFQEQVMKLAILVAGYTPDQADGLRRDMASWRASGNIDKHEAKFVGGMLANGVSREFAERTFQQICGFGEYGFPESHAASFALIAYATAWLRCHHPAAFLAGLLNAQPMGFYSPYTLVEDAKRHGVTVRPIDLLASDWDCTLERTHDGALAVRMGLRYVKGLGERERRALEGAKGRFHDLASFVRATRLPLARYVRLAEAGAFDGIGLSRRDALWRVRGLVTELGDTIPLDREDHAPAFAAVDGDEAVLWDYEASDHSTRGHPMARFRSMLTARGIPDSAQVRAMPDGARATYVGMVICRQHPATAKGVTFFTLEDELGFVNLVVWQGVFHRHEVIARTAPLLEVHGTIQSKDGVVHLVAETLQDARITSVRMPSRDFH